MKKGFIEYNMFIFLALIFNLQVLQALDVTTFNAGLAYTYVAMASKRRPLIIKELKNIQTDILCLQEVWEEEDIEEFIVELSKVFPHHARVMPQQKISSKRPACFPHNLFGKGKLGSCIFTECSKKLGDDFTQCVLDNCYSSFELLKTQRPICLEGMIAQVGKTKWKAFSSIFNPFKSLKLFNYSGQAGILLLSKTPLKEVEILDYTKQSTSVRRAAILAQLEKDGRKITVGCTHLTSNLEQEVPYPGVAFKSWGEENTWQMKHYFDSAIDKSKKHLSESMIIMGDFNCSFENSTKKIQGELESSCQVPINLGFTSIGPQECTYCSINPLVHGKADTKIDHVFYKGDSTAESEIVFNQLHSIHGSGFVPLSDHYGLKVNIKQYK